MRRLPDLLRLPSKYDTLTPNTPRDDSAPLGRLRYVFWKPADGFLELDLAPGRLIVTISCLVLLTPFFLFRRDGVIG
jgi:hypothetical protein